MLIVIEMSNFVILSQTWRERGGELDKRSPVLVKDKLDVLRSLCASFDWQR